MNEELKMGAVRLLEWTTGELRAISKNHHLDPSHPLANVIKDIETYASRIRSTPADPSAAQELVDFANQIASCAVDAARPNLAADVRPVTGELQTFVFSHFPTDGGSGLRFS